MLLQRTERARAERRTRRAERRISLQDMQPYDQRTFKKRFLLALIRSTALYDDEVEDDNTNASDDEDHLEAEAQRRSVFLLYRRVYLYVRAGIRRAWTALRRFVSLRGSEPKDSL
ncbi:hypothetical protein EXIGLDRAFT_494628 [Exidia glandulosa HHB12029]|uniref:Uncharacterized protein n=1 Tax=Exidia glandulosa HHB12029 TaxID=1314781 RepID=A0A165JK61_EXIGL|nr:hypothetical protein EXIGLDRAFT_494628 [Exidia glandulosa HHB12029]